MSTAVRSLVGSPCTIHSANARPAPGRRNPDRVEASSDEEPLDPRDRAEEELVVRCEALRPVVELADADVGEDGQPMDRTAHEDLEVLPVLVEQLELERVGQLVWRDPRLGDRFETPTSSPPTSSLT